MRFFLVVLVAASLASAASVFKRWDDDHGIPSCAKHCVDYVDPYPCSHDDKACRCTNTDYHQQLGNCIASACSYDDAKKAAEAGKKYCEGADPHPKDPHPKDPLPKCGVHCIEKAPKDHCRHDDAKCLCKYKPFLESVIWCFKESCKGEDFKTAKCAGEDYCKAVGVDISSIFGY
ncbi:hypothetical protein M407DRAFT_30279 [Tulasnella calospora MUT 4182]|uniref:CFEM domain-containing protein n=1 Tax=Tulasnella calospora MUT 4182 TaxID=1051891 RepID=A0A0C3Q6V5_9AGAM|nr:hypothetical protein M407DRAFT_31240 [Tulasnella calospora MUT 4182]KIO20046.1 hypothetical protein M407DRAFT_30279 [Tulasnella calospora MUT 4182]